MNEALNVDVTGEGPPLVLLHGWAMHSEMWGSLVPRLAKRFRVHAVDLPGHGHSAPLPEFSLDTVVAVLSAAFAANAEPLTVVGWSLGGVIAMRWALASPERVGRVVLVATSPRFVAGDDWQHGMPAATLARFGDELRVAWKLTMERFLTLQLRSGEHSRATLSALRAAMFARGAPPPSALVAALAVIRDSDLRGEIAGIAQPALVVAGEHDTLALPGAGRWLAAHMRDARFALIPGAAHMPFLSHADTFAAALDPFLDGR